jgi:ATP phosphoribosyltransferase
VLVEEGVVDLGITGSDHVAEKAAGVSVHQQLGFGRCRLSVAVHRDAAYRSVGDLAGKVVGTKFVALAARYFEEHGVADVHILPIQGAVEVMVLLGLVDGIVEIVETGNSLVENDLVEIDTLLEAQAVLIGRTSVRDSEARDRLLRRIEGVLVAARHSLVEYNCPAKRIEEASRITPGFSSPTVQELRDPAWLAVKVLVEKDAVQQVMDDLEELGCTAILETELRHTRL